MMMVYQTTPAGKMEQVSAIRHNSWIHLTAPTETEINQIVKTLHIPREFVTDPLDIDEQPRLEQFGEAKLIVIHVPIDIAETASSNDDVKYRTIPFGIVLTKDHMVTICRETIPFVEQLFQRQAGSLTSHMKTRNTLTLISEASQAYVQYIETIEQAIVLAEDELAKSYRNRELYALLHLNESLLYMTTSLKQMQFAMRKIGSGNHIKLYDEDSEILEDALVELEQAYEMAEINQSNMNNIMDAYGNVIQNNVNRVLKMLAAVTIILSVPTLIASIYGMNVPLPYQDAPHAFSVLIVAMVVLSGMFTFFFYKKRYF
ncbi:magnesium transporter CorA family protein [Paenibacillus sp. GCM10027626]|uniref:magnesium transporter CorA family protein n=1 Tax=Paenibacillus sp. GCM10027626 TaxID=3273411 RepID=UPI00363EE250